MNPHGMTLIVRKTAKLVTGFIAVFGIYVASTGHLGPGGGFAGGVVLAAAAVLIVLAFGRPLADRIITESQCHVLDAAGALGFLVVALLGYQGGIFFFNWGHAALGGDAGAHVHRFASGGTILLSNLAIMVKVGAGLAGAFLALAAYRRLAGRQREA